MKTWVRFGYCPHGMPHFVTTHYAGAHIVYQFIICETHHKVCGLMGTSVA